MWDLTETVRIMDVSQHGAELDDRQAADIVTFPGALTGEQSEVAYPILPGRGPDTPKPDPM